MAKLNWMLTFCIPYLALNSLPEARGARSCPQHIKSVPIDNDFMFGRQPSDGFYAAFASGEDSMPSYKPRRMNPAIKGAHKTCIKPKVMLDGKEMPVSVSLECSYKNSISVFYCEPKSVAAVDGAMSGVGFKIPKHLVGIVVDTDNKTFMAIGLCVDGSFYEWMVFSTQPHVKVLYSRTAERLNITKAEVKEAGGKKVKPGQTKVEMAGCPKENPVQMGIRSLGKGLKGFFNG